MRLFIARIQGFIKYKDLMGQLISRDLKLKYRRSVLGYLWSILNPLFIMESSNSGRLSNRSGN